MEFTGKVGVQANYFNSLDGANTSVPRRVPNSSSLPWGSKPNPSHKSWLGRSKACGGLQPRIGETNLLMTRQVAGAGPLRVGRPVTEGHSTDYRKRDWRLPYTPGHFESLQTQLTSVYGSNWAHILNFSLRSPFPGLGFFFLIASCPQQPSSTKTLQA